MSTKSSGMTLIELLVVVAVLGIISTVGVVSYNGYVSSSKKKAAENILQQIGLGQTEWYSEDGAYFKSKGASTPCTPSSTTSDEIEEDLLGEADVITKETGYEFCSGDDDGSTEYKIVAKETGTGACEISMDSNGTITRSGC
tara:strand:- start:211 stop:636 length:426 start_codon:yes stop_codon:yes gene_type:complete